MSDLIERQVAIDELKRISFSHCFECGEYLSEDIREIEIINSKKALEVIEALPSEQLEIVRCKDCKWYELPSHRITENCVKWMKSNGILLPIKPNDYCSRAERRTDE